MLLIAHEERRGGGHTAALATRALLEDALQVDLPGELRVEGLEIEPELLGRLQEQLGGRVAAEAVQHARELQTDEDEEQRLEAEDEDDPERGRPR